MMRTWIAIFAAALTLLLMDMPVQADAADHTAVQPAAKTPLQQHVQGWTEVLSKQPSFKAWKTAVPTIMPLGPGSHGWLVTLTANRKPVGYMIVNATENNGYQLGEYGVGGHPAFDPDTMYNALIRQGLVAGYNDIVKKPLHLERLYFSPMLAAWKWTTPSGETYFFDPWTGESLPINEQAWTEQAKAAAPAVQAEPVEARAVTAATTNKTFDPYARLPWLTHTPLSSAQLKGLSDMLDQVAQIRYTAELFKASVLYVLPAIGYHRWNDSSLFVAFDQAFPGTRYIALETLQREGHFYR